MALPARTVQNLTLSFIFFLLFAVVYTVSGNAPDDHVLAGKKALEEKRIYDSEESFLKVLKKEPDNFQANFNLGYIYRKLRRMDEAESHLRKALEKFPSDPNTNDELGLVLFSQNKIEDASKYFFKATELDSGKSLYQNHLGMAYMAMPGYGHYATYALGKAMELDPTNISPYINMGWYHYRNRDYEGALAWYMKGVEIEPNNRRLLFNISETYKTMRRMADYTRWLTKARSAPKPPVF